MPGNISEQISELNSVERVFQFLIDKLEYNNTSRFCLNSDERYDAAYVVECGHQSYTLIGIKVYAQRDEELILRKHLQYWNENDVPFSILVLPDEIRIYNNFTISRQKILYTSRQKKDDVLELFKDKNIMNGMMWGKIHSAFKKKDRVDSFLLNNLRNTVMILCNNCGMDVECAYHFIAQCIFIKYMEDRQILTEVAFSEFDVHDFNQLLGQGDAEQIRKLFLWLKKRFNGDLFDTVQMSWPTAEQLAVIRTFFDAEEIYADHTIQYTMYKYDFSKIPIELISNIYETFFNLGDELNKKKSSSENGAYYTPYYLADFINDSCIGRGDRRQIPVVLDPACGSGVFLVGAFRKIVERKKSACKEVSAEDLKEILLHHIYGVDRNREALRIACFSLYIALLEYLTPKDIQKNQFTFPDLMDHTLLCCDFFDSRLDGRGICADIVVGNPPWVSDRAGMHNAYCKEQGIPLSDGQTAQAFIARVQDFMREDGTATLIVTNSIFTNENAALFREYLLTHFQIQGVLNLDKIRESIFLHASAPCSILDYRCGNKEKEYTFRYNSFRPNLLSETFHKIVYDKGADIAVRNTVMLRDESIWRILCNGDEYDVRVIARIKSHPKLSERGYSYFRGYAVGTKDLKERKEFLQYKGGNLQEGFHPYLIQYDTLPRMRQDKFGRPRKLERYLCRKKLLIKQTQNEKLSGAAFCEEPVIFTDDYHCLYDTGEGDGTDLKVVEAFLNSGIFTYYRFFASKAASAMKPELTKGDILSFPIPAEIGEQDKRGILERISRMEELLRQKYAMGLFCDYERQETEAEMERVQSELDQIICRTYAFDEVERAAIEYALQYVIRKDQDAFGFTEPERERGAYEAYVKYMENYFNHFLQEGGMRLHCSGVFPKNLFTLISFSIQPRGREDESKEQIKMLGEVADVLGLSGIEAMESELLVKRRLAGFLDHGFFVVKEREAASWTRMSAIKDADYFARMILTGKEVE